MQSMTKRVANAYSEFGENQLLVAIYCNEAILYAQVSPQTAARLSERLCKLPIKLIEDSDVSDDGLTHCWIFKSETVPHDWLGMAMTHLSIAIGKACPEYTDGSIPYIDHRHDDICTVSIYDNILKQVENNIMTQEQKLIIWMSGIGNIRNIKPVKVTFGNKEERYGVIYNTSIGKPTEIPVEVTRLYLLGNTPKSFKNRSGPLAAETVYTIDGFEREWFVSGYYIRQDGRFDRQNPCGSYFMMAMWDFDNKIDHGMSSAPWPRSKTTIEYL